MRIGRVAAAVSMTLLLAGTAAANPYDFNGDGRDELVFAWQSPGNATPEDLGAGPVFVLPGARRGVSFQEQQVSVPRELDPGGHSGFGAAVAGGDFDGDGYSDLAVGSPSFRRGDDRVGAVSVFRGSVDGLAGTPSVFVRGNQRYRAFGHGLTAGDLNRDGFDDLVVAAPELSNSEELVLPGYIRILFGSRSGLSNERSVTISKRFAWFGLTIALGHVNGDRHLDLVEASPGVETEFDADVGVPTDPHAYFCPGTASGPRKCREMGGGGGSLAVADVNGDGRGDVVQGDPVNGLFEGESPADEPDSRIAGHVQIWLGTREGPSRRPITLTQDSPGVPGTNEASDRFGNSVDAGRIDGDRFADIVVSAPREDGYGRVTLLRGGRRGIARRGHAVLHPAEIPARSGSLRVFGSMVLLLDFTGDGRRDLAVSAPDRANRICECTPGRIDLFTGRAGRLFAPPRTQAVDLAAVGVSHEDVVARERDAGSIDLVGRAGSSR